MNNKFYSLLGLCKKSGNLYCGNYNVKKCIKDGKAILVIIAQDVSEKTENEFVKLCNIKKVPYLKVGYKRLLGNSIGKSDIAVICIKDINFSNRIINVAKEVLINGGE